MCIPLSSNWGDRAMVACCKVQTRVCGATGWLVAYLRKLQRMCYALLCNLLMPEVVAIAEHHMTVMVKLSVEAYSRFL
jgi:hypothetical protein